MAGIGILLAQCTLHREQKIERPQGPFDDSHRLISQGSKHSVRGERACAKRNNGHIRASSGRYALWVLITKPQLLLDSERVLGKSKRC